MDLYIYRCNLAYLNLNAEFTSEILNLILDFIKFTFRKGDSHNQVVPNILKLFLMLELCQFLKFKLIKIKY